MRLIDAHKGQRAMGTQYIHTQALDLKTASIQRRCFTGNSVSSRGARIWKCRTASNTTTATVPASRAALLHRMYWSFGKYILQLQSTMEHASNSCSARKCTCIIEAFYVAVTKNLLASPPNGGTVLVGGCFRTVEAYCNVGCTSESMVSKGSGSSSCVRWL